MQSHIHNTRKSPRRTGSTAGSALITVLGVSLILMLAGATMVALSRQSIYRIQRRANYAQAQAVAEAGVADMLAKLGTNYSYWQTKTYTAPFLTNGNYYVVTKVTNGHVLITSDGIYKGESNRTILELLGSFQTQQNGIYNLNSAVFSGGSITFSTGAYTMNGDVHANGNIILGGNGTVSGLTTATGAIVGPTSNVVRAYQVFVPLPHFDFDNYRQLAIDGGTYLEGAQTLSGRPIASPTNGILYVNGNLTIKNNSNFAGTIVVNGNVTIVNQFTQQSFAGKSDMPSILSTGSITISNHTTLNGVLYATVDVNVQNNLNINGGIISGGNTYIQNSADTHATNYPAWDPMNPAVPSDVVVGGWLQ